MKKTIFALVVLTASTVAVASDLPIPQLTPGATNPQVTQATIDRTICSRGWTKTIRPPAYFTNRLKKVQMAQYNYPDRNPKLYEEDHLVPLELGGAPADEHNLWPEPRQSEWGSDRKDELENVLKRLVCSRQLPLADAQRAIATNWIAAYQRYVGANVQNAGYHPYYRSYRHYDRGYRRYYDRY